MTTIHDIAKKTGFSVCTISQVLNGHPKAMKMRRTTVETILAAAKELNYTPSFAARTLATGRSCTVGLILGDIQDDVFSYFHEKFIESARAAGCRLLTLVTDWNREQELAGIRELRARGCDGIFLGVGSLSADPVFCARLAEERYPIISYGAALEGISSVIVDYRPGIEDMLARLSRRNRRIISFLSSNETVRNCVIEEECGKLGLEYRCVDSPSIPEHGDLERFAALIRQSENTAFIFSSSTYAMRTVSVLHRQGIAIPEHADIVGIGMERWSEYFIPSLSTVSFDVDGMMNRSMELLLNYPEQGPRQLIFPTVYHQRASTLPSDQNNKGEERG